MEVGRVMVFCETNYCRDAWFNALRVQNTCRDEEMRVTPSA